MAQVEGPSRDPSAVLLTLTLPSPAPAAQGLPALGYTFSMCESPCGAVRAAVTALTSALGLQAGDVILTVNGLAPESTAQALQLLSSSSSSSSASPAVVRVLRRRGGEGQEGRPALLPPPASTPQYWARVASAIGPWVAGSDPHSGPATPAVALHSITLHTARGTSLLLNTVLSSSTAPGSASQPTTGSRPPPTSASDATLSGASFSSSFSTDSTATGALSPLGTAASSGGGGTASSSSGAGTGAGTGSQQLQWTLYGGAFCREPLGRYTLASVSTSASSESPEQQRVEWRLVQPAMGTAAAASTPAAASRGQSGLVLRQPPVAPSQPGAVVEGDFRLVLTNSRGSTLAALWLNTAFLPLPPSAQDLCTAAAAAASSSSSSSSPSPPPTDSDIPGDYSVTAGAPLPTLGALLSAHGASDTVPRILESSRAESATAVFSKAALDKACKDRKDKVWGVGMQVALHYTIRS